MALITEVWTSPVNKQQEELRCFLRSVSLSYDPDIDHTVIVRDEETGEIAGTGSRKGYLLKCVAVAEKWRHHHVLNQIMTALYEGLYADGITRWCGFTKPQNTEVFRYEGLFPVFSTDHLVLLENKRIFEGLMDDARNSHLLLREALAAYEDLRKREPRYFWIPEEIPDYFIVQKESSLKLRQEFSERLTAYIVSSFLDGDRLTETICTLIQRALREEVSTTPKPGLVDLWDNGAHDDMDPLLFSRSTAAVSPYLTAMFEEGRRGSDLREIFHRIRILGMDAEKQMSAATAGVNTHKGMIFTMGIICAALGYVKKQGKELSADAVLDTVREMVREDLAADLRKMEEREPATHGEMLYRKYGLRGVRGQAMDGFPVLRSVLNKEQQDYASENERDLAVLLEIMSVLEDTNILYRGTFEDLEYVQKTASEILKEEREKWQAMISEMNHECIRRGISPGGAADLLAASVFLPAALQACMRLHNIS